MAELIDAVVSWPSLLGVLVVFGFAPGFCLRLVVLAYPRGDPRRDELIAELYAVPRIDRPLWIAEQLEVALFEGLAHRVSAARRRVRTLRQRWRGFVDEFGFVDVWVVAGGFVGVVVGGFVAGAGAGAGTGEVIVGMEVGGSVGALVIVGLVKLADRFKSKRWPPC